MHTATVSTTAPLRATEPTHATIARITHALSVMAEPGQVVELRIPGLSGRRTDSGYFTDFEQLARCAARYSGRAEGIYITLNPVHPALLARSSNRMTEFARNTTADKDVTRRRWLFIDFDAVRPAGISSSDAEHDAAIERAFSCRDWLLGRGIPCLIADSGNGAHGLIPVDLPNDSESLALVKDVLQAICERFSDDSVEIDTSTSNASRIIKLYGTVAAKGDNIPERPHRPAQILEVPTALAPVERAALAAIAALHPSQSIASGEARPPVSSATRQPTTGTHGTNDRTPIDAIKASFDMVAFAESVLGVGAVPEGEQFRLPGNQGFLIHPEKGCWYHHGGQVGGDALDLVGYLRFGPRWHRQDAGMFRETIAEAARFAGVALPGRQGERASAAPAAGQAEASPAPSITTRKADLMDIAQAWKERYADELAWDVDRLCWRRWTGTHWQEEREAETLDLLAVDVLRALQIPVTSTQKIDALIRLAKALCKRQFESSSSARLVNFRNGTLDLDTLTGHVHNPLEHLTECLPYDYDPKGSAPAIQAFLNQAIPDPEGRKAYMTHVGLALIGDRSLHKALVLLGPPRSGKTTLLKLAQLTLGVSPGRFPSAVLFSAQGRGANSRATWRDASPRLVCLDEFPEEAVRDEGEDLFKSMTAHGGVALWHTYQREQSDNTWTPKLLFATNNRMRYRDSSGALTRRLLIVTCPNGLPDHRLDGSLLDKLSTELGAFAAQCIRLALEAQRAHAYPESIAMRALLSDIERSGDAVKLWASEQCIVEPGAFTSTQTLYSHFRLWCEENGLHAVSRPKLRDMLCGNHVGVIPNKQRIKDPVSGVSKPIWGLVGIRLRTDADDE